MNIRDSTTNHKQEPVENSTVRLLKVSYDWTIRYSIWSKNLLYAYRKNHKHGQRTRDYRKWFIDLKKSLRFWNNNSRVLHQLQFCHWSLPCSRKYASDVTFFYWLDKWHYSHIWWIKTILIFCWYFCIFYEIYHLYKYLWNVSSLQISSITKPYVRSLSPASEALQEWKKG